MDYYGNEPKASAPASEEATEQLQSADVAASEDVDGDLGDGLYITRRGYSSW
jgi:hypothetical protein